GRGGAAAGAPGPPALPGRAARAGCPAAVPEGAGGCVHPAADPPRHPPTPVLPAPDRSAGCSGPTLLWREPDGAASLCAAVRVRPVAGGGSPAAPGRRTPDRPCVALAEYC